jgi:ferrochelatase
MVKELNIEEGKYRNSFQSRLLKDPWLKPYTDHQLESMAEEGIKKLAVITPAFVSDCLETLEEIAMEGKEEFLANGGEEFIHISCLNEDEAWVEVMKKWITDWQKQKS